MDGIVPESPGRRSSRRARSPSRSCSRPRSRARLLAARRSAWPYASASSAAAYPPPIWRRSRPATAPAWAAGSASAAGNPAAKNTPASCRSSSAPAQTPGPPPDQALALFREAATAGDANSMVELAEIYSAGIIVNRNDAEAISWYRKAAEIGDPRGMLHLGGMYSLGAGVGQDYRAAAH